MAQRESTLSSHDVVWNVIQKELNTTYKYMLREPYLGQMLNTTVRNMERHICSMVSFVDTDIDLQPWERYAEASYVSDTETSLDLMKLMRDVMGHASIPAMHGNAFLDKYPEVLHDIYELDKGMLYLIMGLPAWTPWSPVISAHNARRRLWEALDAQQVAMDAQAKGEDPGDGWGDMEDVSPFTRNRNEMYRDKGFAIRERGELPTTWALIINSSLIVYWQILYILDNPSLLAEIRSEIEPHITIHKPMSIGRISEAPRITIDPEGLTTCHVLKATYLESLRLSAQPWSVRTVGTDVTLKGDNSNSNYLVKKGEYVTMPHDLHMRDPAYFSDPAKFDHERFLVRDEEGKITGTDMKTIRPYGGGPSLCKGRVLAERECLALVAGVLAYWDFEPDEGTRFRIPKQLKTSAVARPDGDTRVKVRRRKFEWDE
ncbi:putative 25-hydroxycholesterol 7-alpha-hydroxylase [Glarea lozoyensis 74030]|uniref:Putative 25-hydroxycholesterol 7-alpha-hydroxylase n=1 Tax=Glarea lozoyensis (strain ATCC 74030 / MF5533) TaxID=1104152 RepID=H0EII1_GLAL7|nr:putative 25-hydroxycholesterol 7-alpha-hydroxylase [Glarea lozoyensis 74030]